MELTRKHQFAWERYNEADIKTVHEYSKKYIKFISDCKTERECITEVEKEAISNGYVDLATVIKEKRSLKAGDKVYVNNRGKAIALFHIGTDALENGMAIIGAHVDAPRIDIKQNPIYEDSGLALFETHYYGGIKKYQWVATPLALHGVVVKRDGTVVNVVIGEDENDPVLGISDLLIHLSGTQMQKTLSTGIEGEDLNVFVGSIPSKEEKAKDKIKENVLSLLNERYGITEEDFVSAELELVPAGKAREMGIDRSMIMGYGHDDRICSYVAYDAIFELETVNKTAVALLVDKEEVGSIGATGMHSKFFENAVAEIADRMGVYSELVVRRAFANSMMLSADVTAAFDPNYAGVYEKKNSAFLGKGVAFAKYTGSRGKSGCNDADAEFMAKLRGMMDKHNVLWQTAELGKVDQGGGGTIAYILAQYGMDVIDCGVALHNMHAPWEVASKADLYETYKAYKAFYIEA